jgi:hypothetical protein
MGAKTRQDKLPTRKTGKNCSGEFLEYKDDAHAEMHWTGEIRKNWRAGGLVAVFQALAWC